jgi:hypothetical protein
VYLLKKKKKMSFVETTNLKKRIRRNEPNIIDDDILDASTKLLLFARKQGKLLDDSNVRNRIFVDAIETREDIIGNMNNEINHQRFIIQNQEIELKKLRSMIKDQYEIIKKFDNKI